MDNSKERVNKFMQAIGLTGMYVDAREADTILCLAESFINNGGISEKEFSMIEWNMGNKYREENRVPKSSLRYKNTSLEEKFVFVYNNKLLFDQAIWADKDITSFPIRIIVMLARTGFGYPNSISDKDILCSFEEVYRRITHIENRKLELIDELNKLDNPTFYEKQI